MGKWLLFAWPRELRRSVVLGINRRNVNVLTRLNPKPLYALVDDKLATKLICRQLGINVPETYAVLDRLPDIRRLEEWIGSRWEFVIKPVRGAGGRGVFIVAARNEAGLVLSDGRRLGWDEVRHNLALSLSGAYSKGGRPDRVVIEERIAAHGAFADLAFGGTADVRILLLLGRPVMAMLRLPTRRSGGRANLHQDALGLGVNIATGRTCGGVRRDRAVSVHPDTAKPLGDVVIPRWQETLQAAEKLAGAIGLGYLGVDLVLDEVRGPVVLEANGRPGLGIQIANRRGLLPAVHEALASALPLEPALPAGLYRCSR
jgi:alpha-L-glutamate ligase-like protein